MRRSLLLVPVIGLSLMSGCDDHQLLIDGRTDVVLAVGGEAVVSGESRIGGCVAVGGSTCDHASELTDLRVRNPGIAEVFEEGGVHRIQGLAPGTARLVATLAYEDSSARSRLRIPVVEATGILVEDQELLVTTGEAFTLWTTLVGDDHYGLVGHGLHTLYNPDGLLVLDEDGGPEHRVVAGSQPGTAELWAELTDQPIFEVVITAE